MKIALVPYRDRGDSYVTQTFDLTDDIDAVFANLKTFTADGGGDEPESVNEALAVATSKVSWSKDRDVLKLMFLVGDAPPHMDYANDVKYPETCQRAAVEGIVINAVQCGDSAETAHVWKDIATHAEGHYVKVGQSGDMRLTETPMDKELAATNAELNSTVVLYGTAATQPAASARLMDAASRADVAMPAAAAGRIAYKSKAIASEDRSSSITSAVTAAPSAGDIALSGDDLVAAVADKRLAWKDVKQDQLPVELQKMPVEQQQKFIADREQKRQSLRAKLDKLAADRDAYLAAEQKKHAAAIAAGTEKAEPFDEQVTQIIHEEAARQRAGNP